MKTSHKEILRQLFDDKIFKIVSDIVLERVQEIRLRINKPIVIIADGNSYLTNYICGKDDIKNVILSACENSFSSYEQYIKQGYLPLKSGGRIGIAGIYNGGSEFDGILSINIRFADDIKSVSDDVFNFLKGQLSNVLISGPPGCGKTTMLRDLVRKFSYNNFRVAVADERGEICGSDMGNSFDLGNNCDYIVGLEKSIAISRLLRTMNPQIIAFDEIGTADEAKAVFESFNSGVDIITTLHAKDQKQLDTRIKVLFGEYSPFEYYIILNNKFTIEKMIKNVGYY